MLCPYRNIRYIYIVTVLTHKLNVSTRSSSFATNHVCRISSAHQRGVFFREINSKDDETFFSYVATIVSKHEDLHENPIYWRLSIAATPRVWYNMQQLCTIVNDVNRFVDRSSFRAISKRAVGDYYYFVTTLENLTNSRLRGSFSKVSLFDKYPFWGTEGT